MKERRTWIEVLADGKRHRMGIVTAKFHLHRCCECAYKPEDDFQCHREDRPCGEYQMMVKDFGVIDDES